MSKRQGRTHLILPDSHAHPDHSNRRYDWLSGVIEEVKPDVIIDLGDFADMPSISAWDGSRAVGGGGSNKTLEGARYNADIEVSIDARKRMMASLDGLKKRPELHWCEGNHEQRIRRVSEHIPELDGKIGIGDLQNEQLGWKHHKFLKPAIVDGVAYAHYFVSGTMGRPIGGDNAARQAINKLHMSCVWGHSHIWCGPAVGTRPDGKKFYALNPGVYDEFDHGYAGHQGNQLWWRGLVVLRNVKDGEFEIEQITMDSIRRRYSSK